MSITSDVLVDNLYQILTSSIANTRFFNARSLGFRAELEYMKMIRTKGVEFLDAGQFVVSKKEVESTPENYLFYMTISDDDRDSYLDFYGKISQMPEIKKLFFIKIGESDEWGSQDITVKDVNNRDNTTTSITKPVLSVYRFDDGTWVDSSFDEIKEMLPRSSGPRIAKNKENRLAYLLNYDRSDLISVYCNRYVLDVELGEHNKGMMDFDLIVKENEKYVAIETKEKDPMGKRDFPTDETKWAFGWDSRRIGWYMHLKLAINLDTRYVIREVNNQTERRFVKWKMIDMDRFRLCASWLTERAGGGGGGTISAPYNAFVDI